MTAATERSWYDIWFKDGGAEEGWKAHVAANCADGYSFAVIRFAYAWMCLMQKEIRDGKAVADVADATSHAADRNDDPLGGLTGFQYGVAVSVIAQVWEHGDELRRWHNLDTQIGDEGERANESGGVLNPAIMSFGPKE
jgi:hypothetical protein